VYAEAFDVCDDGEHTLEYYSVDNAENIEEINGPFDFKIDQTPPQISLSVEKQSFNKWLFIAEVEDATSGIALVEFYVDDELVGEITEPPYYYLWTGISFDEGYAIAYDNAGNSAESDTVSEVSLALNVYQEYFVQRIQSVLSL
jgi:alpha-amylase/alpha-mannosidase (GH57 family)